MARGVLGAFRDALPLSQPTMTNLAGEHAERAARSLYGKATSVKVVQLPDVPEDGGDLSDWADAGGTADDDSEAPEWRPRRSAMTAVYCSPKHQRRGKSHLPCSCLTCSSKAAHAIYSGPAIGKTFLCCG